MQALTFGDKTWIKLKSAFLRITLNRVTAAFFLFSFFHCFAQGIIQAFLFSVDSERSTLISAILQSAQLCKDISFGLTPYPCVTVFDFRGGSVPLTAGFRRSEPHHFSSIGYTRSNSGPVPGVEVSYNATGAIDGVDVSLDGGQSFIHLDNQCTRILVYADQVLKNSKREDCALISVQFWLFSISFIAIMYDSIPHTLAVFCARVLVTGWSAYTIWRTMFIEDVFRHLVISPDSPCHANLFPKYFKSRTTFEIPDLVLNCTALFLSAILSWRLLKTYKTHSFKSLGAPAKIIRIYKYFMAVLVCLQLSVFILVTAMALWINQLSSILWMSLHTSFYVAGAIFTAVLLIPWIIMGWYGIRRENKRLMSVFLVLGFIFISGWALMFYSLVYRWTFLQWPFLASLTVASYVVMIASMVLGIVCWLNFHQGLAHYLYAEDALASSDFEPEVFPHDAEKDQMETPIT